MNTFLACFLIYATLAVMHVASWYSIVYRVLFIDRQLKPCPSRAFRGLLAERAQSSDWSATVNPYDTRFDRTWLEPTLNASNSIDAAAAADEMADESERYIDILQLVSASATILGLLGTVAGFLVAPNINSIGLNVAFQTTFAGIVVGLPAMIYVGWTQRRRDAVAQQIDELRTALAAIDNNWRNITTAPPTLKPPLVNESIVKKPPAAKDRSINKWHRLPACESQNTGWKPMPLCKSDTFSCADP